MPSNRRTVRDWGKVALGTSCSYMPHGLKRRVALGVSWRPAWDFVSYGWAGDIIVFGNEKCGKREEGEKTYTNLSQLLNSLQNSNLMIWIRNFCRNSC